jgi:hypothetical protein
MTAAAIVATGWCIYLSLNQWWQPLWVTLAYVGTGALWLVALAGGFVRRYPALRWTVALALLPGVLLGAIPIGLNVWVLLYYGVIAGALDAADFMANLLIVLLAGIPVFAGAHYCYGVIIARR